MSHEALKALFPETMFFTTMLKIRVFENSEVTFIRKQCFPNQSWRLARVASPDKLVYCSESDSDEDNPDSGIRGTSHPTARNDPDINIDYLNKQTWVPVFCKLMWAKTPIFFTILVLWMARQKSHDMYGVVHWLRVKACVDKI